MDSKLKNLRNLLKINKIFPNYPDDLLEISFFSHNATTKTKKNLDMRDNDRLEFLGDRVLKIIYGNIQLSILNSPKSLQIMLESNRTFSCYLTKLGNICGLVGIDKDNKKCADLFEAFIGSLFQYGYYEQGIGYSILNKIQDWLMESTPLDRHIDHIMEFDDINQYEDDDFCCTTVNCGKRSPKSKR